MLAQAHSLRCPPAAHSPSFLFRQMKNTLGLPPFTRAVLKETGAFFPSLPEPVPEFVTKEDASLLDLPLHYIQHDGISMTQGTLRQWWKGDTDESELKLTMRKSAVPPSTCMRWEGEFNLYDADCAALLAKHADQFEYNLDRHYYVQTSAYVIEHGTVELRKIRFGNIRIESRRLTPPAGQRSSLGGKIVRYKKRALQKT